MGQHLQSRPKAGILYEAAVIGAGAAAIWTFINYKSKLDDYEDIRTQLSNEALKQYEITAELSSLEADQQNAYDKAKTSRVLAIAAQITLGVVWGINALDAGLVPPAYQSGGVVFEALPTSEGGQILVRASF